MNDNRFNRQINDVHLALLRKQLNEIDQKLTAIYNYIDRLQQENGHEEADQDRV